MRQIRHHLPRRSVIAAAGLSALLASALVGLTIGGAQGAPAQVGCGDRIMADTTLHQDLMNCPNNGILIGADNVTLDLNGHTIDGNRTPDKSCDPVKHFCDFGVAFGRHEGVTVKDGSIRQFEGGILVFRSRGARLLGLSTPKNHFSGIGVAGSARILVRNSSGNGSTHRDGNGIGLFDSRHVRVLNSTFKNNVHLGLLTADSTNSVIKGDVIARNGDGALLMEGGEGFRMRGNRVIRNGGGITLGPGSDNVITRNRVRGGGDGIRIEKGRGNLVAHNVVIGGRNGIRLGIHAPFIGGKNNHVRGNLVRDSRADGFLVNKKDHHSLLERNIARGAGDDGFDVASPSTTLTRNRALDNGDFGIEAVPGVIDGGENKASGNGRTPQCLNVVCR
jgi:parallel beta-helix repeat protein